MTKRYSVQWVETDQDYKEIQCIVGMDRLGLQRDIVYSGQGQIRITKIYSVQWVGTDQDDKEIQCIVGRDRLG